MIRALKKKGEVVWYAPDHDYGPTASVSCPTVCGRPGGDHLRHLDAGENVQSLHRALRPASQTGR